MRCKGGVIFVGESRLSEHQRHVELLWQAYVAALNAHLETQSVADLIARLNAWQAWAEQYKKMEPIHENENI